jgi:hypothetical protein
MTSPGSLDDGLRRALREIAGEVPADSVPPLVLPPRRRRPVSLRPAGRAGLDATRTRRRARPRAWTRARSWATVAGSAALAAGVLAAATGLAHVLNLHQEARPEAAVQPGARFGAATAAALPSRIPTPVTAGELGVPAYYLALTLVGSTSRDGAGRRADAVVRATRTGQTLARVGVPRPYRTFTSVTAAADDRTFVLAAQQPPLAAPRQKLARSSGGRSAGVAQRPTRLFVLRLDPGGAAATARTRLTALPLSYVPAGTTATGLALSPDGTRLAVSVAADEGAGPAQLRVVDLASGIQRAWSPTACRRCGPARLGLGAGLSHGYGWLSWAADDRTLAFVWSGRDNGQVRLLDTAKPGTGLLADSRLVPRPPPGGSGRSWQEVVLTPDGQTILAVTQTAAGRDGRRVPAGADLVGFSPATGKQASVLSRSLSSSGSARVLWTSGSGSTLVVSHARPGQAAGAQILRPGRDAAIPWSGAIIGAAW